MQGLLKVMHIVISFGFCAVMPIMLQKRLCRVTCSPKCIESALEICCFCYITLLFDKVYQQCLLKKIVIRRFSM